MPVTPLVLASEVLSAPHFPRQSPHHEKRKFRCGFREHVGGMREWNLVAIGVGAIDVVKTHRNLRHNL